MRDFADFVMARNQRLKQFKPAFEPLVKEIARHQSSDGSFQENALDDTPEDAYRYGVWFLLETGYFQPKDRFWTDQAFPDAQAVHTRIEAKLKATGLINPGLREAYESLQAGQEE